MCQSVRIVSMLAILWAGVSVTGAKEVVRDIEYSRVGELPLLMNAYLPVGEGPFPAVVIVHGGAWVSGDRHSSVEPLFVPLTDAGVACFSISYRLAPQFLYPAAVEDVEQAVRFVRRSSDRFRIDNGRIALLGESAGAQLVALAASKKTSEMNVRAVVSFYGPNDLILLARTSDSIPEGLKGAIRGSSWGGLLLDALQNMSPIAQVHSGMPPFLFIHGSADTLVPYEQSKVMCERMRDAGASCSVFAVEGGSHGLRRWEASGKTEYKLEMTRWLTERLRKLE